jgi:hypothetical protein
MDPEDKKKLDRVLKLAEENNEYVRQVRRTQKNSQMWKAIYWVVIITFAFGGFYFLKPYLSMISSVYTGFSGRGASNEDSSFKFSDANWVGQIIDQIKGTEKTK